MTNSAGLTSLICVGGTAADEYPKRTLWLAADNTWETLAPSSAEAPFRGMSESFGQ